MGEAGNEDMASQHWPSVAVVVPNHSRFSELAEAVASVEAQKYEGQVRVYVVYKERHGVDGLLSTLGGVVAIPSTGEEGRNSISVKRNIGLNATTEDLVAFLDDDDLWHPRKLSAQVAVFQRSEGVVAVGSRPSYFSDRPVWRSLTSDLSSRKCSRRQVIAGRRFGTSSLLVDGVTARDLRFDERPEWLALEDYEFKIRLSERGEMWEVNDRLTAYRFGSASVYDHRQRRTVLKAVGVLVASLDSGISRLSKRLAATRLLLVSAVGGFGSGAGIRGMVDAESERTLDALLRGRLLGRGDRLLAAVVRTGWRRGWRVRLLRPLVRWPRLAARAVWRRLRSG